jgi:hypothetical protein
MPIFDDDELERMEASLEERRAAAAPARGGNAWIAALLILAAAGVVTFLIVRHKAEQDRAAAAAPAVAADSGLAARSAAGALSRPAGSRSARRDESEPAGGRNLEQELEAQREQRARIERQRVEEAEARRQRQEQSAARRRGEELPRIASWWATQKPRISGLEAEAARLADPRGRVDVACRDYVAAVEAALAAGLGVAPSDELAAAVGRFVFFHSRAADECRASRFQSAQAQLASAPMATVALRRAIEEALSR